MDFRSLRSFVLLAEQLHFGRTARLLHLSQPALSKQIKALEDELGGALFERNRHGAALTVAGRSFVSEARALLAHGDRVLQRGQQAMTGLTGTLAIGFGVSTFELVPHVIARFRSERPGVEITLVDMSTAAQVEGLRSGALDVGFLRFPVDDDFATLLVRKERAVLVTPSSYPARSTLKSCSASPFVAIASARAPGFHGHMLRLCGHHGIHPHVVQEAREFQTVMALVAAGIGAAIVPESVARDPVGDVRVHTITGPEAAWQVGAAWRAHRDEPLLRAFLDLVRAEQRGRVT